MGEIAYATLPIPAFDAYTERIRAGAVTIGVEYRVLDEQAILDFYGPDARAKFGNRAPAGLEGTVAEDGLSLHVFDSASGDELLRFDCFENGGHYHLLDPDVPTNRVIEFDPAEGEMVPWALERIRRDLPQLLARAGRRSLARAISDDALAAAWPAVERAVDIALRAGRPVPVAD